MNKTGKRIGAFTLTLLLILTLLLSAVPPKASAAAGQVANVVIFVRYADDTSTTFADNWAAIRDMYDKTDGAETASLKRYISIITDGTMNVTNYFPQDDGIGLNVLTVPAEFKGDDDYNLLYAAIEACSSYSPPSGSLDNRESGVVDNFTVLVQGSDVGNSSVYPHKGVYSGDNGVNGKLVRSYNVINSDALFDGILRQGVICHEFLHSMGLPDLYRYNQGETGQPVGVWDIMASTSLFMQYPLYVSRQSLGCPAMTEISAPGTYTLDWVGASSGTRGLIIKTPLSATEYFAVEFRKSFDQGDGNLIQAPPIDFKVPSTGLLIYRVNPNVENHTNAGGNNYIYVFRPGSTDKDNAEADVMAAAVAADSSYGSTDLAADFTQNTIYYADGRNSGVAISDIQLINGGSQLQFTVSMPDYNASDLWTAVGAAVSTNAGSGSAAINAAGQVCVACEENGSTVVRAFQGGAWTQAGSSISGLLDPQLLCSGGSLYLLGTDYSSGGTARCYLLNTGGAWERIYTSTVDSAYLTRARFVSSASGVYASFHVGNELYVEGITDASIRRRGALPAVGSIYNPSVCLFNGSFYAAYVDMDGGTMTGYVARLDDTGWVNVHSMAGYKLFSLITDGDGMYLAASGDNVDSAYYTSTDGTIWNNATPTTLGRLSDVQLVKASGAVYVGGISGGNAKVFQLPAGTQLGPNMAAGVDSLSMAGAGDTMYVATGTSSGGVSVGSKGITAVTPPEPPAGNFTVTVTPPAGYADTVLWIDGVAHTAAAGTTRSVTMTDGSAKTAVMYKYNSNGVPVGMYVWELSYSGGAYTATAVPGLEDLLTYHGYSIRVAGVPGIRFKTGISTTLRTALLSSGVSGYRMVECGTIFTNNANLGTLPFVKNGRKIGLGRAYWTENGVVNDWIFETVAGRHRFTSVITGIPDTSLRTEYAFRGYITLTKGGVQTTFYGPVLSRSVFTVANQVLAAGEFAPGSAGDIYVRGLISRAG